MRFLHVTDLKGQHHLINPLHIVSVEQTDYGCMVFLRGRAIAPIELNETVELMGDALNSGEVPNLPQAFSR